MTETNPTHNLVASIIAPSPTAAKKRPWYAVKRILGTVVGIVGGAMVATGGTLVVTTLPVIGIPITVATVGWIVAQSGIALFGYGWGANNQKIADEGEFQ